MPGSRARRGVTSFGRPPIVCAEPAEGLRGAGPGGRREGRRRGWRGEERAGGDAEPSGAEEEAAAAEERAGEGREGRKRATASRARWLDPVLAEPHCSRFRQPLRR